MDIWSFLLAIGLPAAIVGAIVKLAFDRIEKKMERERLERQEIEARRRKHEVFLLKTVMASAALGKANAIALKNGHCNGETSAALAYLDQVKRDHREFLAEQGIDHLF